MRLALQEFKPSAQAARPHAASSKHSHRLSPGVAALLLFVSAIVLLPRASESLNRFWLQTQLPDNPDVMLVGSSVIGEPFVHYEFPGNVPIAFLDQHPVNRARKLEAVLAKNGCRRSVWSSAVIGQMLPKTVQFVENSLTMNKRPQVIVLFIAPTIVCDRKEPTLQPTVWEQTNDWWQAEVTRFTEWKSEFPKKVILFKHILFNKSTKFAEGWSPAKRWAEFHALYANHYRSPISKWKLGLITHFLDLCQRRAIKVLIVSTPLAAENRELMVRFKYTDYQQAMEKVCQNRCQFVDLGQSPEFKAPGDFLDGAHCNGSGAEKMYRAFAPYLVRLCNQRAQ